MGKNIKKRKFNILKFFLTAAILYILGYILYNSAMLPIRHIRILNTTYLKDQEILRTAKIDNYPSFIFTTSSSIKNKLKSNPFIKDVKVKKRWFCVLDIYVDEYKILFYDTSSGQVVLENGKTVSKSGTLNVPVLINYVPNTIYNEFIEKMGKVNSDVLVKISEIEYRPNDVDKERFLLTMNDGNYVYLTLYTFTKVNEYNQILTTLEEKKGILYLDSGNYFDIIE